MATSSGGRADPSPDPVYDEIRVVRDLVEQVVGVLTYSAQDPAVNQRREKALREYFGRSARRVDVYLALSRDKNISEVADSLGMKRQNVSREIQSLHEAGLIVPLHTGGRGDVWVRNRIIESVVGLSKKLATWRQERARSSSEGSKGTITE